MSKPDTSKATPLPWRVIDGELVGANGKRVVLAGTGAALSNGIPSDEALANGAVFLASMDNAARIEKLEEALRRTQPLIRLLTVRQVIEGGDDAILASGLNPWCMNEGLATGDERISADWIEWALESDKSEDSDDE